MRALFFGTSEFAVPSLQAAAQRLEVAGVVTQPDRPGGRGQRLRQTAVKAAAVEMNLPLYEPLSLRDFARDARALGCDLFIVASYGKILPQALLDAPKLGALNVHPSLLPKYRGATPIQGALLAGDRETGVTIMLMDAGMDTGGVVLQERTPIGEEETYGELHDRLARFSALTLAHAIDLAASGHIPQVPQRGEASSTKPLRREDLEIDWEWPAARIVNAVRAYSPAPAARASLGGVAVKLIRARAGESAVGVKPGAIMGVREQSLRVRAADRVVEIAQLIAPNRPVQSGAAFAQRMTS